MSLHLFNFAGGEYLTQIGATWFVSYSYYELINPNHINWTYIKTHKRRITIYNNTKQYHIFWLKKILRMNPKKLNKNEIGISATTTKKHAKELLLKQGINISSNNTIKKIIILFILIVFAAYYFIK